MTDDVRRRAHLSFDQARKSAALQDVVQRLRGRPANLLSFDQIGQANLPTPAPGGQVQEVPLAAVVGSLGRYQDFSRDFLPRSEHDRERWVRVKMAMDSGIALPPVDLYQVGDIYFVIDGNHRVSIARTRGDETIRARVTRIPTRVAISPSDSPADLIRKVEYNRFLVATGLDSSCPSVDFRTTEAGTHPLLLEQVEAVRSDRSASEGRDLALPEAAVQWYEDHYLPVVDLLREWNLLRHYPNRTETDLYVWLLQNHQALADELGWEVRLDLVAAGLARSGGAAGRVKQKIRSAVNPDAETGDWRSLQLARLRGKIFSDVVVFLNDLPNASPAFTQALSIARIEDASLLGLVIPHALKPGVEPDQVRQAFAARCEQEGLLGQLGTGSGPKGDVLRARARWADLLVLPAPEGDAAAFRELLAGLHTPVWIARPGAEDSTRALLAFDGSPKAHEALFLSAYLACLWGFELSVVTALEAGTTAARLNEARAYLEPFSIEANYLAVDGLAAEAILQAARSEQAGLIVAGSYRAGRIGRRAAGRTLDALIRQSPVSLLVCR